MESTPANHGLSRRDALKVGGGKYGAPYGVGHGDAANPGMSQWTADEGNILEAG